MNRQGKEAAIADFKELLSNAQASFVVQYKGLSVHDLTTLRGALRKDGGKFRVTKARLMKIAATGLEGSDDFKKDFREQIGLVFAMDEIAPIAKQLLAFAKDHEALKVVSGFYESKVLSAAEVEFIASLPSKDVLLAQLAGALQAPISGLARVLNAPIQQLACALGQIAEKGA